jgi:hypothetical protein
MKRWRRLRRQRFIALASVLVTAAGGTLALFGANEGNSHMPSGNSEGPSQSQPSAETARLIEDLIRRAETGASRSRLRAMALATRNVYRQTWKLASARSGDLICLTLTVPGEVSEGSCTPTQVLAERIVVPQVGRRRFQPTTNRRDVVVVYGLVSAAVRSLRLGLSDCAQVGIEVRANGMFWKLVTQRGPRLPTVLEAVLRTGETKTFNLGSLFDRKADSVEKCGA